MAITNWVDRFGSGRVGLLTGKRLLLVIVSFSASNLPVLSSRRRLLPLAIPVVAYQTLAAVIVSQLASNQDYGNAGHSLLDNQTLLKLCIVSFHRKLCLEYV
ncbi:hypothetical protein L6452_35815 [Arctium lappa]|uniref:Uncharacterized protein n=1 Tax=Arctium lappa TaxID=4217 RepID=A0ACB8Y7H6_ARCLA|nr:hypothetical protein L6452_35815 [Arctium lappa]